MASILPGADFVEGDVQKLRDMGIQAEVETPAESAEPAAVAAVTEAVATVAQIAENAEVLTELQKTGLQIDLAAVPEMVPVVLSQITKGPVLNQAVVAELYKTGLQIVEPKPGAAVDPHAIQANPLPDIPNMNFSGWTGKPAVAPDYLYGCGICGSVFSEYVNGCPKCAEKKIYAKVREVESMESAVVYLLVRRISTLETRFNQVVKALEERGNVLHDGSGYVKEI